MRRIADALLESTREMIDLQFERRIDVPAERIFDVLSDLAAYQAWLPPSPAFVGLKLRDESPIQQGARYVDITTAGAAKGEVTVFDHPHRITFVEGSTRPLVGFSVEIAYHLEPLDGGASTRVVRTVKMTSGFLVNLLAPLLAPRMRTESHRILDALATRCASLETRLPRP